MTSSPSDERVPLSVGRLLLALVVGLVLLMGACGVGFWRFWTSSSKLVEERLARIRDAGEPATLADLNKFYAAPVEDDATQLFISAFEQFDTPEFNQAAQGVPMVSADNDRPIPPPGQPWPDRQAVADLLDQYQPAMQKLKEAAELGGAARYPKDFRNGYATLMPNVQRLRFAARMLSLQAQLRAHQGDASGAAESIRHMFILSRSLRNEPTLVSYLVRIAAATMAIELIEKLTPHVDFTDEDIARLRQELQRQDFQVSLTTSLLGERVMGITATLSPGSMGVEGADSLEIFGPRYVDAAFYMDIMNAVLNASRQPFPQALDEAAAAEAQVDIEQQTRVWQMQRAVSLQVLPALQASFEAAAQALAQRDAADAALAVEQFRRQNERLPDSLDELVPEFLASVPLDPFNGKLLQYRRAGESGFIVYSVGRNRIDDGGQSDMSGDLDIVFRQQ